MSDPKLSFAERAYRSDPTPENAQRWAALALRAGSGGVDRPSKAHVTNISKSAFVIHLDHVRVLIHHGVCLAAVVYPLDGSANLFYRTDVSHSRTSNTNIGKFNTEFARFCHGEQIRLPQEDMDRFLELSVFELPVPVIDSSVTHYTDHHGGTACSAGEVPDSIQRTEIRDLVTCQTCKGLKP